VSEVLSAVGEATGLKPNDAVIAHGMADAAKMKCIAYLGAVLESTTPEVRHLLTTQLETSLAGQERIAKLVVGRGWYAAQKQPDELLTQALEFAKPVLQ
jgi:spore coat protein CotF